MTAVPEQPARVVAPVGHQDQQLRPGPLIGLQNARVEAVNHRRSAARPNRLQRRRGVGHRRAWLGDARDLIGEGDNREPIAARQLIQQVRGRGARDLEAVAGHASADVEHDAKLHRLDRPGRGDALPDAVVTDLEVAGRQPRHGRAVVGDQRVDADQLRARAKCRLLERERCRTRARTEIGGGCQVRTQDRQHHQQACHFPSPSARSLVSRPSSIHAWPRWYCHQGSTRFRLVASNDRCSH